MRQRKKEKQLLAVALSALLAVGGLPTMVFADGGGRNRVSIRRSAIRMT